tara:strand:- start:1449 stop:1691 length:243 start_codon:yes stop_codon:yes gene_type:complete
MVYKFAKTVLALLLLGFPALVAGVFTYGAIGANSCEWYGDEFDCWGPPGDPIYYAIATVIFVGALVYSLHLIFKKPSEEL